MASNVFGNPVTNSTLEGMPEYVGKKITPKDRAHVALLLKTAEDEATNARTYVENLKKQWGNGVSTLVLIYNATGDTITYVTSKHWYGRFGPAPYPITIANGQWGAFLHVKNSGAASGSCAAIVYRGLNDAGATRDWLLAWSNPWNRAAYDNTAYTQIREYKNYNSELWNNIYGLLIKSGYNSTDRWGGCVSSVVTGSSTSPIFEGILTLEGA